MPQVTDDELKAALRSRVRSRKGGAASTYVTFVGNSGIPLRYFVEELWQQEGVNWQGALERRLNDRHNSMDWGYEFLSFVVITH